jgi:hypothetical protein
MRINRKRLTMSIALVASLLLSSVTLTAQVATSDWSRVTAVESGSKLVIKLKTGKSVEGKLSSASDTGLSLSVKDKPVDVKREEVLSVYQITKKSAAKATLIGLGVGAGAGAGIGLAGSAGDNGFDKLDKAVTAGLTVLGAGAGALAGFLIGKTGRKRVLIYQAHP